MTPYMAPSINTMKVTTKLLIAAIFFCVFIFIFIYCERFVYYFVLTQCNWPRLDPKNVDPMITKTNEDPVRFMVISDPHLLGSNEGYWIDKIRTDWEMKTAFETAINIHHPEVVFVLGDLTIEGEYCPEEEFNSYIGRFYNLFSLPKNIQMYIVAGNHDIGFHNFTNIELITRFEKGFNAPPAQLLTIQGNHFVLVNSVTLQGDGCSLCASTELELSKIENTLKCANNEIICDQSTKLKSYSRPILLQGIRRKM